MVNDLTSMSHGPALNVALIDAVVRRQGTFMRRL